jgi:hypothetical protein
LSTGLIGGGVGEQGVSGGFPAGSDVGESADDEGAVSSSKSS